MRIEEIVKHDAQLIKVELVKVIAEKKDIEGEKSNELNIEAEIEHTIVDSKHGIATAKIKIYNNYLKLEINENGYFEFSNEIEDIEKAGAFLEVQGVRLLWSYAREDIHTISSKMLLRPIILPTIDVLETIKLAKAK